jgi:hypothetical protein
MFWPKSNNDVSLKHVTSTLLMVCVFIVLPVFAQPAGGPGGIITPPPPGNGSQHYEMRTVVKDLVTTEWTLQCPDGSVLDMSTVSLTDKGMSELFQCLGEIEQAGIQISSHTVVKDFVVESDEIISTVQMTEDQVNKIKEIIDKNKIPMQSLPLPSTRPHIESVLLDGALDSFTIDLGQGCILDLTSNQVPPQILDQLIQLLQQFEMENGVFTTGATTVKDGEIEKDRVIQITNLLPAQIEQIVQFLQSHGFALLFDQILAPLNMQGVIISGENRFDFDVQGDVLFQFMPPDPQTGEIPLEIRDLQLLSVNPLGIIDPSGISVGLAPGSPQMPLFLRPVDHTGKLMTLEGQITNLVFNQVGPEHTTFVGDPDFGFEFDLFGCGPWPFMEPMCLHSLGYKHLLIPIPNQPAQTSRLDLSIEVMTLRLPLRVPVAPGGNNFPGGLGQ